MHRHIVRLSGVLLLISASGGASAESGAPPTEAKPSLLFVTTWCNGEQEDVPLVDELRRGGFLIDDLSFHKLTLEKMSRYNAVIFPEFPRTDPHLGTNSNWQVRPERMPPFFEAIDAYVKGGGGVVVYGVCFFQTHKNGMQNMNRMLKAWHAETLFEQVLDKDRQYLYRSDFQRGYSWTSNLASHPLTRGLNRVFYVTDSQHGPMTCTFKLSDDWTVLVRGEPSARSVPHNPVLYTYGKEFDASEPGTYASQPPIVAIREYGRGRIALIGVSPVMAVFGARFTGYGNVLMEKGNGVYASDYGMLQERLFRWVAGPAMAAGRPGGYEGGPLTYRRNPDLESPTIDWARLEPGEVSVEPMRGVIGARTAAAGGSGDVADYVAAAGTADLDYIAFTQDMTKLTPSAWQAFKKECEEQSP